MAAGHGGDDHGNVGDQPRGAAFDVEEPLSAHVRSESGFGDEVFTGVYPDEVGHDGRVPVRDVPERPGVHEHRGVLECLQQVGLEGIAHDHRHGAGGPQLLRRDRLARRRVAHDDPPEAGP
jgi:hypothetical protein